MSRALAERLTAAFDELTELGWGRAAPDEAKTLPLGTPAQQYIVKAALRTGGWDAWYDTDIRRLPHALYLPGVLAVYGARVGLPVRRIADLIIFTTGSDPALVACADILAEVSAEAEGELLNQFCFSNEGSPHEPTGWSETLINRVHERALELPAETGYLRDFWAHAGGWVDPEQWEHLWRFFRRELARPQALTSRFAEHVLLTAQLGAFVTGPFGVAVAAGVERGWISREQLLDAAVIGMDVATRPGDRKVWASTFAELGRPSPEELRSRVDALVPVLAGGNAAVVETVGVPLLAAVPEDRLGELVLALSPAGTAKARRAVLAALDRRPTPSGPLIHEVLEVLEPWAESPGPVANALRRLASGWGVAWDPGARTGDVVDFGPLAEWPATPALWEVPRVLAPAADRTLVLELASELLSRTWTEVEPVDLAVERFLDAANALAHADPEAMREVALSFGGESWEHPRAVAAVMEWAQGARGADRGDEELATRRVRAVARRLGEGPVLLASPSWEDLRIDEEDLLNRLSLIAAHGTRVTRSDLLLALTRLELSTVPEDLGHRLQSIHLEVVAWDGGVSQGVDVAQLLAAYVADPVLEPTLVPPSGEEGWCREGHGIPASLRRFPLRPGGTDSAVGGAGFSTYPHWGDAVGLALCPYSIEFLDGSMSDHVPAMAWAQLARRSRPLPPGLAVNLLAGLARTDAESLAIQSQAVHDAWQRGLLEPGTADLALLDWTGRPTRLVALARAWGEAAELGLLPVVWPLFDQLCAVGASAPRLPAGMVDVVRSMQALRPSVVAAVADGKATPDQLELPGLRTLAARSGSAQAMTLARGLVEHLPPAPTPSTSSHRRQSAEQE